ncbi:MAG TPA: cell division protein FtsA [Terriglobia bacterium]|nr:cell division protein FtsA [Terriglobia bacterium]
MARKQPYVVGLDLGSDKTCALVCRPAEGGKLEVMGVGVAESKGWRKGLIVNLDAAALSVKKAIEDAESAAGVPIESAYAGVGGPHIKGVNSRGALGLGSRRREVTREDLAKVHQAAHGVSLPEDRELLQVEPQQYLLDSQNGIRQPVGMVGTRLEVSVHLVTASSTATQNVITVVNRQGIRLPDNGIIFEPLAAAEACLTPDEREMGIALIDIGAGSSGLVAYRQRAVQHTAVIPVGGEHFTNDIAVGLRTPVPEAEKMKRAWGERDLTAPADSKLEIPGVGERPASIASYAMLTDIIEPRAVELLELIQAELDRSGIENQLGRGIVLSGGGAKLGGFARLAEQTLRLPVRLGVPTNLEKMGELLPDPAFSTVAGLAAYGYRHQLSRDVENTGWTEKLWSMLVGGKAD